MKVAAGTSILKGIAIGTIRVYHKEETRTSRLSHLTPEQELSRFQAAQRAAQKQLEELYTRALETVGERDAAIFEIHQMMLEDEDYVGAVREALSTQGVTAEYAVQAAGERFSAAFSALEDPYLQVRAADVRDVSRRVVDLLTGAAPGGPEGEEPFILAADDLTPSETVQLDRSRLLGFLTRHGSPNSHTAILARTMGIPALVGVDFDDSWDGHTAILDGYHSCVYVDPG